MDCIIQIFISDYPLTNGCMESKIINTWYWYFFINIKAYGYLILILTLNLMSVYWMYYWSNKIDVKSIFFIPLRLLGFYMLISFLGSLIYLFILYQWYSALFFIIFFMLVTNGIGRILDRRYDKEDYKLFLNKGLRNIKIFSGVSIVCNLYAVYQIFYYYQI